MTFYFWEVVDEFDNRHDSDIIEVVPGADPFSVLGDATDNADFNWAMRGNGHKIRLFGPFTALDGPVAVSTYE